MGTLFFAGADVPGVWGLLLAQGGFGGGAQPALPVLLYLALAVLAVLGAWLAGRALLDGRARAWLIREADRGGAGGPRAVVVVSLSESRRLPGAKLRGAMRSLGLYLSGFIREGEACERIGRREYGLVLGCGVDAAFLKRLTVLRQDVRCLYMAAYPGLLTERVAFCRLRDAANPREALRRARGLS